MPEYIIKVHNKSDAPQHFMLFNELPNASPNAGQVWANVWVASSVVDYPRGTATFTIDSEFFAVCGQTDTVLTAGVKVATSDYAPVAVKGSIDGTKVNLAIEGDGPVFRQPPYSTASRNGSFAIATETFNAIQFGKVYCGLGRRSARNREDIVPVAVWPAKPNQDYEVTPVQKFFIATGSHEESRAVDITTFGKVGTVDFTSMQHTTASIDFTAEYNYTPASYSN